jgi:hypothetical protein
MAERNAKALALARNRFQPQRDTTPASRSTPTTNVLQQPAALLFELCAQF